MNIFFFFKSITFYFGRHMKCWFRILFLVFSRIMYTVQQASNSLNKNLEENVMQMEWSQWLEKSKQLLLLPFSTAQCHWEQGFSPVIEVHSKPTLQVSPKHMLWSHSVHWVSRDIKIASVLILKLYFWIIPWPKECLFYPFWFLTQFRDRCGCFITEGFFFF